MNRRTRNKKAKLKYQLDFIEYWYPDYNAKSYSDVRHIKHKIDDDYASHKRKIAYEYAVDKRNHPENYAIRQYDCHNKFTAKLYENQKL